MKFGDRYRGLTTCPRCVTTCPRCIITAFVLLAALMLVSCGKTQEISTATQATTAAQASLTAQDTAAAASSTQAQETTAASSSNQGTEAASSSNQGALAVFQDMDGIIFAFTSGVGAWQTSLKVAADGSFEGEFYDMNMGESSDMYENGTVYECFFKGKFAEPVKRDVHTLVSKVEKLSWEEKVNYVKEGTYHVQALPYGLSEGDEVTIYLPGTKTADLSEEFLSWAYLALPKDAAETTEILLKVGKDEYCFFPDHYAMGDAETFYSGEEWDSERMKAMKKAYTDQKMPAEELIPAVPAEEPPAKPYESVTLNNLQGSWVNVYNEGGSTYTEILTINGDHGKIVTYRDDVIYGVWNGEGTCSIEDRSESGKCPAFRIDMPDGTNLCTIYIRRVSGSEFYDGGFLKSWYYRDEDEPDDWLYDTVTPEKLEGVWYSEQTGSDGRLQTVLVMKDGKATLFETLNGAVLPERNGKGSAVIQRKQEDPYRHVPQLTIDFEEGAGKGKTAGITISVVDENRFYDLANRRYFVRVY